MISAGKALYQRNPIAPPISAAPSVAMSTAAMLSTPRCPPRTNVSTFIAVNVKSAIVQTPALSPSMPSVRFAPFAAPAITKKTSAYQNHDRSMSVPTSGR